MKITSKFSIQFLLVVLISTFMSPSFAWQMIDSHHETTIASFIDNVEHHHHERDPHHHHHHDNDGEGDSDTAHNQIGHLLSHLPAVMQENGALPVASSDSIAFPTFNSTLAYAATDPPFKPPVFPDHLTRL